MKPVLGLGAFVAACVAILAPGAAQAARCGLTTVSGGNTTTVYDPFNPAATTVNVTNLVLSRVNGANGEKTSSINFFIQGQSPAQNGSTIVFSSGSGSGSGTGYNQNLFFNYGSTGPSPLNNSSSPPAGVFRWEFSGNNAQSDTFTVSASITLPQNLNLTAGTQLSFDIVYSCAGTGGGGQFSETGTVPGAITANIEVRSALRASFVGTALDFGELAQISDAQASAIKTSTSNYVRVQSSGPYSVSLAVDSTDANPFTLTPGASATTDPLQRIRYSLKFLGQTRSATATSAITQTCARAGVGDSVEDRLPLQGTLIDGGSNKAVSPSYSEYLIVTVTPLAVGTSAPVDCGNIAL